MSCTRSPTPRIISHTTPENLDGFTFDQPVTKSGATLTYGPYKSIAPLSKSFLQDHQLPVLVHYNYDHPVLEVTKLKRAAEISHWGANLNIQDEIALHNAGPA
jgi:oligosaccharyltransferase complex subunit alpha (ribophorin I)